MDSGETKELLWVNFCEVELVNRYVEASALRPRGLLRDRMELPVAFHAALFNEQAGDLPQHTRTLGKGRFHVLDISPRRKPFLHPHRSRSELHGVVTDVSIRHLAGFLIPVNDVFRLSRAKLDFREDNPRFSQVCDFFSIHGDDMPLQTGGFGVFVE